MAGEAPRPARGATTNLVDRVVACDCWWHTRPRGRDAFGGAFVEPVGESDRTGTPRWPAPGAHALEDPNEKVRFADDHWVAIAGGHAIAEVTDDAIYLAVGRQLAADRTWCNHENKHAVDPPD